MLYSLDMPVKPITAAALRPGDGIAIVSTSSPITEHELNAVTSYLEGRGYRPVPMPGVRASLGYLGGSAEQRANDLMAAFADPGIRLILPATGGIGASHLLDLLDYEAIHANPKIFTGTSDPSILCNAIFARAGLVTIHGPTGITFFRDHVNEFAVDEFLRVVSGPIAGRPISGPRWRIARRGNLPAQGRLVGGSLSNFRALAGTPFLPPLTGAVLMLEEFNSPWADIDQMLTHLRLAGVFNDIAGLLYGIPVECTKGNSADRTLDDLVTRSVPGGFPIVTNVNFGHAETATSLPVGALVRIGMDGDQASLTFCEDAVAS
jgi:muramoyltetrapeptide carboxypeptidase